MSNNLESRIIELLADFACLPRERVDINTELFRDLGIDGDEASDFILLFSERFSVELSEFRSVEHFGGESSYVPFLSLLFKRKRLVPISVEDLIEAAKIKSLSSNVLFKKHRWPYGG